jgi:predicted HicB family RNase H-like nuclease
VVEEKTLSVKVMFRMTPDLYEQLAERARQEDRTVSNLVFTLVKRAMQRDARRKVAVADSQEDER